jgi:hypothetical protein
MTDNAHLFVLTGRVIDGQINFDSLVAWIGAREEHWAALPPHSLARVLADTIMLAAYEVEADVRDEDGAREVIAEARLGSASAR